MMSNRLFVALAVALVATAASAPPRVRSQQNPPCANAPTAGKTDKQIKLDSCGCEQSAVQDKPTYRVGASPFGRVGAERGQARSRSKDLYAGLEMPNLKDRQSPEVVGLLEKVLSAREEARRNADNDFARARKVLELSPDNWYANRMLKSPIVGKAYEDFVALQNNGAWANRPSFDWREQGLDVGPVLNQGDCDSCWAFAAMSVYQSSWNLEQLRLGFRYLEVTVPEFDTYQRVPSVQQKGSCGGGWHGTAFAFMVKTHVPHIPDRVIWKKGERARFEEYTGRVSRCTDTLLHRRVKRGGKDWLPLEGPDARPHLPADSEQMLTAYDRALAWGYVNETNPDQLPPVAQLKKALIEHGPLAMPIHGDNCFSVYQGGVFNGHSAGDVTHVMVLMGWDDQKQAWLVKNSWGEEWGVKGYGWVAYGSNNIGLYAAWVQPTPSTLAQ